MQKLRAFTLMELLVGMIVSSIVISFGYATYSLIYKQYRSYRIIKNELADVSQLSFILNNDMANAEMVSLKENLLSIDRKDKLPLLYDFNDSIVLRKENDICDTFKIAPSAVTAGFIFPDQKAIVKYFSFEAKVLGEIEHFVFSKNYSAEILMNYEVQFKTNR